jgi:hypothetical protein
MGNARGVPFILLKNGLKKFSSRQGLSGWMPYWDPRDHRFKLS